MPRAVLGLDVGGANLKAAHVGGAARSVPFALWKDPAGLPDALRSLVASMPPAERLAVTMTGELCDCFESKRQGVHAILDAVEAAAGTTPVRVWRNDGQFVDVEEARITPLRVAAANWLALATFAGRYAPTGAAVLVDVGSTTMDLIPLLDGKPVPHGRTDPERLQSGELLYTGVRRTPLSFVIRHAVAAELFATTLDAYLLLGYLPEDEADRNTADGRPATRAAAHARLARMLCADLETSTEEQRLHLAEDVLRAQARWIQITLTDATEHLPVPPRTVVFSGEGVFLAALAWRGSRFAGQGPEVNLGEALSPEVSRSACAYAVAVLLSEAEEG
jgi:probable H4MPT-linked C1 transfer pathway protein